MKIFLIAFIFILTFCIAGCNSSEKGENDPSKEGLLDNDILFEEDDSDNYNEDGSEGYSVEDKDKNSEQNDIDFTHLSGNITIPAQTEVKSDGLYFFPENSKGFFVVNIRDDNLDYYHYTESFDVITSFTAEGVVTDEIVKLVHAGSDFVILLMKNTKHFLRKITKTTVSDIDVDSNSVFSSNGQIEVYLDGKIDVYDTDLQVLETVEFEYPEGIKPKYTRFCNGNIYLFYYSGYSDRIVGSIVKEDKTVSEFMGTEFEVSGELDGRLELSVLSTIFKCENDSALAVFNVEKSYFESYIYQDEVSFFKFGPDDSFSTWNLRINVVDAELSQDGGVNVIFQDSQLSIKRTEEDENPKAETVAEIPFLHEIDGKHSFFNGSGNVLLIESSLEPYLALYEKENMKFSDHAILPFYSKSVFEISDFVSGAGEDEVIINGGITYPIDDNEHFGLFDRMTGSLSLDQNSYDMSVSGQTGDDKGSSIIRTLSGYALISETVSLKDGYAVRELKLSFVDSDLSNPMDHTIFTDLSSGHILEKTENGVDLLVVGEKIKVYSFDEDGNKKSEKSWNGTAYYSSLTDLMFSTKSSTYVFSYHRHHKIDEHCGTFTMHNEYDRLFLLLLDSDSEEPQLLNFGEYHSNTRTGDAFFDSDGVLYSAFSTVDPMKLVCDPEDELDPRSIVFGYFNKLNEFQLVKKVEDDTFVYSIMGHQPTGNFYVFKEDAIEVFTKDGQKLSAISESNNRGWKVSENGDLLKITRSDSEGGVKISVEKYLKD